MQKIIEEAERVLETVDGVTPVHSSFYELSSNFHKTKCNYAEYYRDVLRYFGCTDITTISRLFIFTLCSFCFVFCFTNNLIMLCPQYIYHVTTSGTCIILCHCKSMINNGIIFYSSVIIIARIRPC